MHRGGSLFAKSDLMLAEYATHNATLTNMAWQSVFVQRVAANALLLSPFDEILRSLTCRSQLMWFSGSTKARWRVCSPRSILCLWSSVGRAKEKNHTRTTHTRSSWYGRRGGMLFAPTCLLGGACLFICLLVVPWPHRHGKVAIRNAIFRVFRSSAVVLIHQTHQQNIIDSPSETRIV